jgi:uridine kinase
MASQHPRPSVRPLFVGIAGGSGSGKSTLAKALLQALPDRCLHIVHDRYYRGLSEPQRRSPESVNFDCPEALETERLLSDLQALVAQGTTLLPNYDFSTHQRVEEDRVWAKPIVLVEGILIFTFPALVQWLDLCVYVEAAEAVRVSRRVARDVATRGRTEDEVRRRFEKTVGPMHALHVAPTRSVAQLVLDGEALIADNVAVLMTQIKALALALPR